MIDYLAARSTELYGDPDADYQAALDRHYSEGAPQGWKKKFVSSYATMHAAEDWAETFAHYLHIRDTLDTSASCGLAAAAATFDRPALGPSAFQTIIEMWLPLSWSLNMVNRSMGHDDLYPFVLPTAVLEKMKFIHTVIDEVTSGVEQARGGRRVGNARPVPRSRHHPPLVGPPQRLHIAGQRQFRRGDHFGQLAQRGMDGAQQAGQPLAAPVGRHLFQFGGM